MLGLFGTLNLGSRSLQTQQQAVEVAGQNLANVNNPAYARQRVVIQTSAPIPGNLGPQGTGADAVSIQQLRDTLVDQQIQGEASVGGYWTSMQSALQYAESNLGDQVNRSASSSAAGGTTAVAGISSDLSNLFNAFQSVSAAPDSMIDRQILVDNAQSLSVRFNQTDQRLNDLHGMLNASLTSDVGSANELLASIADLNKQIVAAESSGGVANDLRDLRQQKIEDLSKLVNVGTAEAANGTVNVSLGGNLLVSGTEVLDTLQTYDAGGGQLLLRTASSATPLTPTGGSIAGTINARDGALATLRNGVNSLASQVITEVNAVHAAGYSLTGSTKADFFTGADAATIQVNSALANNAALIQASGTAGAAGDNQVALALAQLGNKKIAGLNNQTFNEGYSQTVAELGQALASANTQVSDSQAVQSMLQNQRNSVSGVSLDEEMADLVKFQRAYEASAKLVSTIDEMLVTVINLKQ
jgi:flagellar hook-associated protein 1 FlgK